MASAKMPTPARTRPDGCCAPGIPTCTPPAVPDGSVSICAPIPCRASAASPHRLPARESSFCVAPQSPTHPTHLLQSARCIRLPLEILTPAPERHPHPRPAAPCRSRVLTTRFFPAWPPVEYPRFSASKFGTSCPFPTHCPPRYIRRSVSPRHKPWKAPVPCLSPILSS